MIGNVWGQAYNYFIISPILLEWGQFDGCLNALDSTLNLSKQANFAAGIIASQMLRSWLYAMLGDLTSANQFQNSIQDFVQQYKSFTPLYLVYRAQNELFAGEHENALHTFEEINLEYLRASELIFHPYIYTLHVEIYLERGDFEQALEIVNGYLDNLGGIKILVPDLLNQKARALVGLDQSEQAYKVLENARTLAIEQNCRRILWAILVDMAAIEPKESVVNELLKEARQIVDYISKNISDPDLLKSFQLIPRVSGLLNE